MVVLQALAQGGEQAAACVASLKTLVWATHSQSGVEVCVSS